LVDFERQMSLYHDSIASIMVNLDYLEIAFLSKLNTQLFSLFNSESFWNLKMREFPKTNGIQSEIYHLFRRQIDPNNFSMIMNKRKYFKLSLSTYVGLTRLIKKLNKFRSNKLNISVSQLFSSHIIHFTNNLNVVPKEFKYITEVEDLEMYNLHIEMISNYAFSNMTKLKRLRLDRNMITSFKKCGFEELTALEYIDLSVNPLRYWPTYVFNCENLSHLILARTSLEYFPGDINNFKQLKVLDLSDNRIREITCRIRSLTQLQYFSMRNNYLTEIAKEIKSLKSLTKLDLSNNRLTELPKEMNFLKALTGLDLSHNNLKDMSQLLTLSNLKELNLAYNKLTTISSIGNLSSLYRLGLERNFLKYIPGEILLLKNLYWINIDDNPLEIIPKDINKIR
jgi:Leucine-rich repeat (LRR) protein